MIPYIVLILIAGICCFVAFEKKNGRTLLILTASKRVQSYNVALPAFFVCLFFLLALRDVSIGNDTANYQYFFEKYSEMSMWVIVQEGGDVLYNLLMWLIGKITGSYQICLSIVAALTLYPVAKLYMEDRQYSYLKITIFATLPMFVLLFSGLRQWLAMSMGVIAYGYVRKGKPIQFLVATLVAIGFHHSAFMLLPMYWIYHTQITTKSLRFVFPAIALVYIFNKQIFEFLTDLMSNYSEKYDGDVAATGAYTSLILYLIFSLFCFAIPDRNSLDLETKGLRNFLLFSLMLQCFAPIHTLSMRLNYFYIMFIPLTVTKCLRAAATRNAFWGKLAHIVMCVYFTLHFLNSHYEELLHGGGLHTVPYIPFWGG